MNRLLGMGCCFYVFFLPMVVNAQQQTHIVNVSIGTGFFVNDDGYLLTNNHVVNRCKKYTVYGVNSTMQAVMVARDEKNDLALLKTPFAVAEVGVFRAAEPALVTGDGLQIVGFPGSAWKKRKAVVRTAQFLDAQGPQGEPTLMQFSESVMQGNSGGPLMDTSGNVAGVIVAKSIMTKVNVITRKTESVKKADVAINLPTVWRLLNAHNVNYKTTNNTTPLTEQQVTQKALRFIVNVRCVVE